MLTVSPKEFNPVPIINFSRWTEVGKLFIRFIFSLSEISCDCPVLPKKTTPWQPSSITFSAWDMVFLISNPKSLFNIDNVAA